MRSFVALPIPEPCLDALSRVLCAIPVGRPVPEDNMHLTLAFLGDAEDSMLEDLHHGLLSIRSHVLPITFDGLDSFTDGARGLVFAAVTRTRALCDLQARVARAARSAGLDLPRRRFRPHVTLTRAARRPTGISRDRLAAMLGRSANPLPGFTAVEMALYRSELRPDGARHHVLATYPLGV